MSAIATCLVQCGGVALIIDYGHARSAPGDTLQAVRGHRYCRPSIDPGEQDLTAHVDFEALATRGKRARARRSRQSSPRATGSTGSGSARGPASLATANPERIPELENAVDRLCHEEQMGQLFKVMAIHSPDWPAPAGFEA